MVSSLEVRQQTSWNSRQNAVTPCNIYQSLVCNLRAKKTLIFEKFQIPSLKAKKAEYHNSFIYWLNQQLQDLWHNKN